MASFSIEPNPELKVALAYEDADLLVASKPSRLVTTPGKGHETDSLMNGLFATHGARLQNIGRDRDFGLLHRLDRATSGLVLVALTKSAYDALRGQFEQRLVRKFYWAIVRGVPEPSKGVIDRPIREGEERFSAYTSRKVASVSRGGGRQGSSGPAKEAITAFRVLSASGGAGAGRSGRGRMTASLLECRPVTGRLHQIRVHMEMIGHPVLGDREYGDPASAKASPRLALHAHRLMLEQPVSGERLDVRSAFPDDLRGTLRKFGLREPGTEAAPDGTEG